MIGTKKSVITAIFWLLATNDNDPERQRKTSQIPKINAETEKMPCKPFITNRVIGELDNICEELLIEGPITKTAEKPTSHAEITTNIVILCTK